MNKLLFLFNYFYNLLLYLLKKTTIVFYLNTQMYFFIGFLITQNV